ncbi:EamA family transporter [candidate division WOR-3 bacterium]|nr:EamA family transporter [candidate division WOR-3 bacterium]
MIYLILSILSSSSMALLIKYNENRKLNRVSIMLYNYIIISIVLLFMNIHKGLFVFDQKLILLSTIVGFLFAFNFFIYMKLINHSGISLPTLAMRISLVIPVTLSIIFYRENITILRIFGILFAIITIVLMHNQRSKKLYIYMLILLFVAAGIADFSMKYFERNFDLKYQLLYMNMLFFSAAIFVFIFSLFYRKASGKYEVVNGAVLAIPNMFATFFLILALKHTDAIVVFPLINISVIIFSSLLSFIIFKESFRDKKIFALITGIITIILLSIGK